MSVPATLRIQAKPPEIQGMIVEGILRHVATGLFPETAAALYGVDAETLQSWIVLGRRAQTHGFDATDQEVKLCLRLVQGMAVALADFERQVLEVMAIHANDPKNWKLLVWMMERRFPSRWGGAKERKPSVMELAEQHKPRQLDWSRLSAEQLASLSEMMQIASGQTVSPTAHSNGHANGHSNGANGLPH